MFKYLIATLLPGLLILYSLPAFCQIYTDKPPLRDQGVGGAGRTVAISSTNTSTYDIKYHRLEIQVDPAVLYLDGVVTTYFVPVEEHMHMIHFDFRDNMTVDSVRFHGQILPQGNIDFISPIELQVVLGDTVQQGMLDSITIYYHGAPSSGGFGYFRKWRTDCSSQDSVMWTLSEPYGSKNWWPCKETLNDKADSIDMIVTVPMQYRVGSNGLLVSEDTLGTQKRYHWHHGYPIPAYLVAFAASEYAVYSDFIDNPLGGQIEVLNYVYPCNAATASLQTPKLDTIMKFFINAFGQYPYVNEKYGHAECGFGGGMEHSTMSFMGGFSTSLMAHELAHQWFGNKITCGSWTDIWLNEAFATYLEGLTCEQGIGQSTWSYWKNNKINHVTSVTDGSVYCSDTTDVYRIFNGRLSYSKGALLLHMLRWIMGDTAFFSAVWNYIHDPNLSYAYARTDHLIAHLEAEYGQSLTAFFSDWFYGEGWPDYTVEWFVDPVCNKVTVTIEQSHSTGGTTFFEMPVPIRFSNGSQDTLIVFDQDSPSATEFHAYLDFLPDEAIFDPERWLCAKHNISNVPLPFRLVVWEGNVSNNWNNPANWDCGVPDQDCLVHIPAGTPPCAVRDGDIAICKALRLDPGVFITLEKTASLQVLEQP